MPIAEMADVEVFHLSHLRSVSVWDHFFQRHQTVGEVPDCFHAINWNAVRSPLTDSAKRDSAKVGGEEGADRFHFFIPMRAYLFKSRLIRKYLCVLQQPRRLVQPHPQGVTFFNQTFRLACPRIRLVAFLLQRRNAQRL